jgi:hypothetical protein
MRSRVHVDASITICAPQTVVLGVYGDFLKWPQLFPRTIRAISLISRQGDTTTLRIDHREGVVTNILTLVSATELRLQEFKKKYDATFLNRFESVCAGTRYTVVADVFLKGVYRLLAPFLERYIRRQIRVFVLEPVKTAAEQPIAGEVSPHDFTSPRQVREHQSRPISGSSGSRARRSHGTALRERSPIAEAGTRGKMRDCSDC